MTIVRGGPAGPNGAGGQYPNEIETDRTALFLALGGAEGVLRGFIPSGVPGQMSLDLSIGASLVMERGSDGVTPNLRGYLVWADTVTRVAFGPASVAARTDALVAAFVDVEDGPVGTGQLDVGPHLVVVPGQSGTVTPRTDAQITAYLGRGGWLRLFDVPIAATDTQINMTTLSKMRAFRVNDFNDLEGLVPRAGFELASEPRYMRQGPLVTLQIQVTRTGAAIVAGSTGNITDTGVLDNVPEAIRPSSVRYMTWVRNGLTLGSFRVDTAGGIALTDMYPNAELPTGALCTLQGTYVISGA